MAIAAKLGGGGRGGSIMSELLTIARVVVIENCPKIRINNSFVT